MLLLICNRELLFIGKRKDEDDMAKSTKTYEERIRALEKKEQESIEATKSSLHSGRNWKRKKAEERKKTNPQALSDWRGRWNRFLAVRLRRKIYQS